MNIKLYHTPETRADRVRWLLHELDIPYKLVPIDLFSGQTNTAEYKKIHPHGLVPAIDIDGHVMFESCAICHWLTDMFPDKKLAPSLASTDRQQYEQWMFYAPAMMEPPLWENYLHTRLLPESNRVAEIVPWNKKRFNKVKSVLETELADKSYLVNDRFTTADIVTGSVLMWNSSELDDYPVLRGYVQRLSERPAFAVMTDAK